MRTAIPPSSKSSRTSSTISLLSLSLDSYPTHRLGNDLNASVPNLSSGSDPSLNILTTAQSSPDLNVPTPSTTNIANIQVIDDETNPIEESTNTSDQQQKQTDETTTDEEDDEYTLLKRLKTTTEQIEAPVEGDEDEEEEQQEEVGQTVDFENISRASVVSGGGIQRGAARTTARSTAGNHPSQLGREFRAQKTIFR